MAVDIATIGVAVDTKDLVRGSRELDNFGRSANKASGQTDTATKSMAGMGAVVSRLAGVLGTAGLTTTLVQVADQYTKLNAQLSISARTQADYAKSFQDVIRISNLAQTSLEGTATLYARLANTLKETNVTQQQFANITESVALGLRVSGATAGEAQSAMLQLSQAFASGVLRGEEFNALSEASFPLMQALAKSMGIPIEQLRSLAHEGKITRDELIKAYGDPALIATLQAQAKELNTVSGAITVLKNNLSILVGEFDKTTGSSKLLAQGILLLAENSHILLAALGGIAAFFATKGIILLVTSLTAALATVSAPILAIAGAVTALTGAYLYFKNTASSSLDELVKRETELEKRIAFSKMTIANRGNVPYLEKQLKEVQALIDKEKELSSKTVASPLNKNALPNYMLAPNFTSTVEVQNVDEINAKLEERAEREKKLYQDRIQAIKDADKAELDRYQARFNMAKEFNDMETKFYNLLEKTKAEDEKKRFDEANARVAILQKQANENFKQAQDAQKEIGRDAERIAENMNRSLTDALLRGFESGLGFAENFKRTLKNMFSTLVLQPIINAVLQPVTSAVSGVVSGITSGITGGGELGSAGGMGGIASTLGGIGNLFTSSNASIVAGIEGFGASIANGMGGIRDSIGGFIGANSAFISKALPFLDAGLKLLSGDVKGAAFSGAGAAIGLAIGGPLGAAVGSFLGSAVGGLFGGKKQPPRTVTKLPDVSEAFNQSLSALIQGFGGKGNVTSKTQFSGRSGGSGYGGFNAMFDGMSINGGLKYKDAYSEATLQAFITRTLTTTLTKAIRKLNIDQAFKDLFTGITNREDMGKTIQAVVVLNKNNEQLTETLGITASQVALLARESKIAGDDLVTLVNAVTGVANELFTIGDAMVLVKSGIDDAFKGLSTGSIPANLKAFDEAIKALDTTTASGRQDFLGLIELRGTFAEFENQILGMSGNVRGALAGIVSDSERQAMMNEDLAKLFGDLNREVPASVQELIKLGKSIDFTTAEGLNLANVFPALVSAFQQTKGAVDGLINSLSGDRFKTFADFAVGASLMRQGVPITQIPSMGAGSQSVGINDNRVSVLLERLILEVSEMKASTQQTADNTLRTTRELEDITGGNVTLTTQVA